MEKIAVYIVVAFSLAFSTPKILVTIDDGPLLYSYRILKKFETNNIFTVWFISGGTNEIKGYNSFTSAIISNNLTYIANHSMWHNIPRSNTWKYKQELIDLSKFLEDIYNLDYKIDIFRPPFGLFTPRVRQCIDELKWETMLWTYHLKLERPLLTKETLKEYIYHTKWYKQYPWEILLLHSNRYDFHDLDVIISWLKENFFIVDRSEFLSNRADFKNYCFQSYLPR